MMKIALLEACPASYIYRTGQSWKMWTAVSLMGWPQRLSRHRVMSGSEQRARDQRQLSASRSQR